MSRIESELTLGQCYLLGKRQIENFKKREKAVGQLQLERERIKIEQSFENRIRKTWVQ